MTYYQDQIEAIYKRLYPKDHLTMQIIKAKQYIDSHYGQKICLDDLAGEAFLSKFHFIRLFKTYYGRTPIQYLTDIRIKKAKQFLRSGSSIADVTLSVGFDSANTFAGLFKKITGTSPSAYRALYRAESTKKQ